LPSLRLVSTLFSAHSRSHAVNCFTPAFWLHLSKRNQKILLAFSEIKLVAVYQQSDTIERRY